VERGVQRITAEIQLALLLPFPGYESIFDPSSARRESVDTRYGAQQLSFGTVGGVPIVVAQQFGGEPALASADVNMRAETLALKAVGVRRAVAFNAYGYLCDESGRAAAVAGRPLEMLDLAVPDDVDSFATNRPTSLFSPHDIRVDLGLAFCPGLRAELLRVCGDFAQPRPVVDGGTVAVFDGPHFPTPAMIRRARLAGSHMGSTTLYPRVAFYREAEVCFAQVCYMMNPIGQAVELRTAYLEQADVERLLRAIVQAVVGATWQCACGAALARYRGDQALGHAPGVHRIPDWYLELERRA
jgi:purine nucleoside phosphorylase